MRKYLINCAYIIVPMERDARVASEASKGFRVDGKQCEYWAQTPAGIVCTTIWRFCRNSFSMCSTKWSLNRDRLEF